MDALPRTVARTISPKRVRRLRISWFILGTLFGIACATGIGRLTSGISASPPHNSVAQQTEEDPAPQALLSLDSLMGDEEPSDPTHFTMVVRKGDTLSDMLIRKGVNYQEAHNIITVLRKEYNPRKLVAGQQVELQLNENKLSSPEADFDVASLRIRISPTETLELAQNSKNSFNLNTQQAELVTELSSGGGVIRSSLYETGINSGVPPAILATLISAYSYDVDFQREIRQGDQFNVVFERVKTEDDIAAGYGKLLYATLTLGGQEKKIYLYTRPDGESGYYDETGQSVRKALLRTPINGARLSSGYGMRRHPVLGYGKMHKGIDFAAPTGTPIYAAGDGVIDYAGRRGSFGNYVRIRHNNQYSTAYAHMSKIAMKSRNGARVKQGQVIGYVGTTGRSTGPHLHYEVLQRGAQINPQKVKFPTGHKLAGQELTAFKANIKQMDLVATRLIDGEAKLARAE